MLHPAFAAFHFHSNLSLLIASVYSTAHIWQNYLVIYKTLTNCGSSELNRAFLNFSEAICIGRLILRLDLFDIVGREPHLCFVAIVTTPPSTDAHSLQQ